VAQFELSVRFPHIVEGEDSGDRHFQLTPCDEVDQLGNHRCGRGIRAACRLDPKRFTASKSAMVSTLSGASLRPSTAIATYPPPKKSSRASMCPDCAAARSRAGRSSP